MRMRCRILFIPGGILRSGSSPSAFMYRIFLALAGVLIFDGRAATKLSSPIRSTLNVRNS